jgi:hypothetical protein
VAAPDAVQLLESFEDPVVGAQAAASV